MTILIDLSAEQLAAVQGILDAQPVDPKNPNPTLEEYATARFQEVLDAWVAQTAQASNEALLRKFSVAPDNIKAQVLLAVKDVADPAVAEVADDVKSVDEQPAQALPDNVN